jgi:uncharacterized Zn finger protein
MPESKSNSIQPVISNCPQCEARLAVVRVIPGRSGCEYWTLRCTRCGGIHLDIIRAAAAALSTEQQPA